MVMVMLMLISRGLVETPDQAGITGKHAIVALVPTVRVPRDWSGLGMGCS